MASSLPPVLAFFPSWTRATSPPSHIRCSVSTPSGTWPPYWATTEAEINAHLAASIPTAPPPCVRDPIGRLISSAPRTMAPVLCIAACELVGGCRGHALGAACALQLLHSAFHAHRSLIGIPSVPGWGTSPEDAPLQDGVMLITADGFLPLGYQLMAEMDNGGEPERVLKVMLEISDVAGARGIAGGYYEEIRYRQSGEDVAAEEWLEQVCKKTEGGLYACAAACGGILGGAGAEETETLRKCGLYVGLLHGFLYSAGAEGFAWANGEKRNAVAGELRSLALSQLEGFLGDKEAIVGLVDVKL